MGVVKMESSRPLDGRDRSGVWRALRRLAHGWGLGDCWYECRDDGVKAVIVCGVVGGGGLGWSDLEP